jgi:hypothetical protein
MLELIIRAFATYRVARMITVETGPFGIFRSIRPVENDHWFNEGMNCPLCASVYVAIVMLLLPKKVVYWLAISGIASWQEKEWLHKA